MELQRIQELLEEIKDPFLHKSLKETGGIQDISVNKEKEHVSVKIAIMRPGTAEQLQLQSTIVKVLKDYGAKTVGLRFVESQEQQLPEEEESGNLLAPGVKTTFLAVASGKGGVGKSTVSANLAVSLARAGKRVGIVDADIYGFSIPDMMGITKRPVVRGEKIIPVERFGVKVISMGFFVEDNAPVIWRGPMLGKMLNHFFTEVEWGGLDYLILDLPPGTGDVALDVHSMLPSCQEVIVTTPHPTAAFVAARAGAMALRTEHKIVGVIENMSYFQSKVTGEKEYVFGRGGGEKLAADLETVLLGQIPLEQPYMNEEDFAPSIYSEDHPIGSIYKGIANGIMDRIEK